MRLYLSSERLGERSGTLLGMVAGPRVAIIANGYDYCGAIARDFYRAEVYDPVPEFEALGLEPEELDLRAHFGDPQSLRQRLASYDLVWVMGGNSFVLRRAMRSSGFDHVIRDLLEADAITYGGYAAGAVVAGPSLRGMELMDDPWESPGRLRRTPDLARLGAHPLRYRSALPFAPSRRGGSREDRFLHGSAESPASHPLGR